MKLFNLKNLLMISFAVLSLESFTADSNIVEYKGVKKNTNTNVTKYYTAKAEAKGINPDVPVILNVKAFNDKGGIVVEEIIVQHAETPEKGGIALPKLVDQFLETQNQKVDTVAGATVSSAAFRKALRAAIKDIQNQIK